MLEDYSFYIGIIVLLLGIPIGKFLARITKEELKSGEKWFKIIILVSFIGAIGSLFIKNDAMLFSFLFMVIVTNQSLKINKFGNH
jgi:hypothetical protein